MPDYTLHYWPLPFRGQFVRAVLAHVGADWTESDPRRVAEIREQSAAAQPVPHMGPPVLEDHAAGVALAQMPAILHYLALRHGLMPGESERDALTIKIVADANDVLYEMTRYNGAQMWTQDAWDAYRPRLGRWLDIFGQSGARFGLDEGQGYMLGTDKPGLADLAVAVLWGTMTDRLTPLRPLLEDRASAIAALSDRILAAPAQAELHRRSVERWGQAWCGGQIEASLRAVLV